MQQETLSEWQRAVFYILRILNILFGAVIIVGLCMDYMLSISWVSLSQPDYVPLICTIFVTLGLIALLCARYFLRELRKLATPKSLLVTTAIFAATCSLMLAATAIIIHTALGLDVLNYLVVSGNISFPILLDAIIVPVLSFVLLGIIVFVKIQWNKYVYWILIASLLILATLAIIGAVPCFICTFSMRMN